MHFHLICYILGLTIFILLIPSCTSEADFDCHGLKEKNQKHFEEITNPLFIPTKIELKKQVTNLFLQKDSVQKIHLEQELNPCMDSLLNQIDAHLDYYKMWTVNLQPYLPTKYWDKLSTASQKNAFLEKLPDMYGAGKSSLQPNKVPYGEEQIKELESFYLFLNKTAEPGLEPKTVEAARIALKDFLAFIASHKQ